MATISYGAEEGLIWRRDLKPTITVEGTIRSGTANDATQKAYDDTAAIRSRLPFGYSIEVDGDLENSQKSLGYLLKPVPVMVLLIMTLLMIQLRSVSLMALTLITAPMGIVGVAVAMLLLGKSLGFVAYLGILALGGMIIRNSVILIDQIKQHLVPPDHADCRGGNSRHGSPHDQHLLGTDGCSHCRRPSRRNGADIAGFADDVRGMVPHLPRVG